ncbi:MAG: hypothetical protein AVDCRST_MAG76-453, partial [uncultured Acidimicrobiales bacterium]
EDAHEVAARSDPGQRGDPKRPHGRDQQAARRADQAGGAVLLHRGRDADRLCRLRPGRPIRHPPDRRTALPRAQRHRRVLPGDERRRSRSRTRQGIGRLDL